MRKKFTYLTIALFLSIGVFAQAPDLINYQAVARDLSGNPLVNSPANILFEIRQGSSSGAVVYSETHNATTNQFGLFTASIGGGTPVTGTFASIGWGSGIFYLGVTINGDAMAATQLLSVPYALHANTASTGVPGADGNDNLSVVTVEPAGPNCATGGNMIEVGVDDNSNGSLEAGEIDFTYYVCNGLDGSANTSDTSSTNELQTLSLSNDTIYLTNGGSVKLPAALGDNWGSDVVNTSGTNISGDGTVGNPLSVFDNDTSSTNELELPLTGNNVGDVLKWNGIAWVNATDSVIDADSDPNNEIELPATAATNDVLTWNGSAWVAQAAASGADNWGSQVVISSGTNISGNGTAASPLMVADSVNDADANPTNEIQNLSVSGNNINISSGTGTTISATAPTTGDLLYWNGINWVAQNVPGNTDNQNLVNGGKSVNNQTVNIQNGTGITFSVADEDSSITNETISNFAVNGANLEITEAGNTHQVPLSSLSDNDWAANGLNIYSANAGNVGIGVIVPTRKLEIQDNSAAFATYIQQGSATGDGLSVYSNTSSSARTLFNAQGNSGGFHVKGNGYVGMGTTTPQQNLHIESSNSVLRLQSTQSTTSANSYVEFGNTIAGVFNSKGYIGNPGSGDHLEYQALTFHRFTTQGTERMRLTNSGELLLGNFSPFSQLDVAGQITMRTGATNGYIPVSDGNGTMTWTDPTTITTSSIWSTNGNGIDYQGGNVGIGIALPTEAIYVKTGDSDLDLETNSNVESSSLHIKRSLGTTASPTLFTGAGQYYGSLDFQGALNSTTYRSAVSIRGILDGPSSSSYMPGALGLFTNEGSLGSPIERMRITSRGEVGIGTTAPAYLFQVENNELSSSYAASIVNNDSLGGGLSIETFPVFSSTVPLFSVRSNGFDEFTVARDGDVGIGTATPSYPLHVVGTGMITGNVHMGSTAPPTTNAKVLVWGSGYANAFRVSGTSDAQVMMVESAGNVGIGTINPAYNLQLTNNSAAKPSTNTWTAISDGRLKKDIKPYEGGLADILKINPVWFTYNGKAEMPTETAVGVIAQDLQKVAPYMINEWEYRPSGSDDNEVRGEKYLGVDNGAMTYMLINAVKEQQKMIEELKEEIEALKNK